LLEQCGAQLGRIREGRTVRRVVCLAVGGARVLFAEGLPQADLEVVADRLNEHHFRVTAVQPVVPTETSAAASAAGAVRYDCLGQEFPSVKVIDFDDVLDGVSPFQPFVAHENFEGWCDDLLRRKRDSD
jgi:hypothetical protein